MEEELEDIALGGFFFGGGGGLTKRMFRKDRCLF